MPLKLKKYAISQEAWYHYIVGSIITFTLVAILIALVVWYALPNEFEANYHDGDIPAGYARVGVDEVVPEFETLSLDIPGGDDEATFRDVKGGFSLWNKKYIVLSGQPTPPCRSTPNQQNPSLPERERSTSQQSPVLPKRDPIESQDKQQSPVLPEMDPIEIESQDKQQSLVLLERDPSASPSRSPPRKKKSLLSGSPISAAAVRRLGRNLQRRKQHHLRRSYLGKIPSRKMPPSWQPKWNPFLHQKWDCPRQNLPPTTLRRPVTEPLITYITLQNRCHHTMYVLLESHMTICRRSSRRGK